MRRNAIFWGMVLLIGGFLLLLSNLGILRVNAWNIFWPLLVIAWGVSLLWRTVFQRTVRGENLSVPLDGASQANVVLRHGAARLSVHGGAGDGDLAEGTFGGGLDLVTRRRGDALQVEMNAAQPDFPFMWSDRRDWDVAFARNIPMTLEFHTGANEAMIDLSEVHVTDLRLKSGASSTDLTLPANAGHTRAEIETGAAAVHIRVPEGVAASIQSQSGLASVDVDTARFPRGGNGHESNDYASAGNRVDIMVRTGVGSVTIR